PVSGHRWHEGSHAVARARSESRRADNTKPTEGAGGAGPGEMPDRVSRGVAIAAPSVGLPHLSLAASAPGTNRPVDTQHQGVSRLSLSPHQRVSLVSPGSHSDPPATAARAGA